MESLLRQSEGNWGERIVRLWSFEREINCLNKWEERERRDERKWKEERVKWEEIERVNGKLGKREGSQGKGSEGEGEIGE